ncbi:MAG: CAP domain-containing protein [Planctomycetota bacterium]|nr:CAP domain-containing protein [Planctomycetota bacterium]MDA1141008.1 CAP domain-containing protein [Planctomycetota bacterium]
MALQISTLFAALFAPLLADTFMAQYESDMLKLVNSDRAKFKLPALELDVRLTEVARGHSQDMAVNGFFGHKSLSTGAPADRYHKAKIAAARLTENVALHQSVAAAQQALMESPGHRKNLLDPKVTHIGIGIYLLRGDLYITQNFLLPLKEINASSASKEFLAKVNQLRKKKGSEPLILDERIVEVCEANSQIMHKKDDLGGDVAQKGMRKLKKDYHGYAMYFNFAKDLDSLLESDGLMDKDMTCLGIGVVKNENKDSGYGMLWVTLVLAKSR